MLVEYVRACVGKRRHVDCCFFTRGMRRRAFWGDTFSLIDEFLCDLRLGAARLSTQIACGCKIIAFQGNEAQLGGSCKSCR